MMLDIIVTHYNEPWPICKPFFDMLACQRGVDFDEFRVILVHDGTPRFPEEYFGCYPYNVMQLDKPHGGVSEARNFGLSVSHATWVQFADCDDTYTGIYSLRAVMSHMDRDVDYMWSPFWVEYMRNGELTARVQEANIVWIHAKYFRRKWLIENKIVFPVGIHYSEDSAFGAVVNELIKPERSGKIKTDVPIYVWAYRGDSVSLNPANEEKNVTGFIDRNVYVVEEFKRRGISHIGMVARMFADAYWTFHQVDHKFPEQEKRFIKLAKPYYEDFRKNDTVYVYKVLNAARNALHTREMDTSESLWQWIDRIEKA